MDEDVDYKSMAKDFLNVVVQRKGPAALDNVKGIWSHDNVSAPVYGVKEGKEEFPECQKVYTLIQYLGIQAGRFGGIGEHKLDVLLKKTNTKPSETVDELFEKHGRENIVVIYTERELNDRESQIISEFEPNFWYLGTLKFGEKGKIESLDLK